MFDERVLKRAPWSISKANLLDLCTRQFVFKYEEKRKEIKKNTSSRKGVVAHRLLELELKKPGNELYTLLEKEVVVNQLTEEEHREVRTLIPAILDFCQRIVKFKEDHGVTKELIEYQLAIKPDFTKASFFDNAGLLRGLIDHGMITKDNILIILDHKSGRKKPIHEHTTQFYAYMLMAVANFPISGVQCGINYIGSSSVDWFPRPNGESGVWSRNDIEKLQVWLGHYLNKAVRKLQMIDSGAAEPEVGWQCEYCSYVDACDVGTEHAAKRVAKRAGGSTNV